MAKLCINGSKIVDEQGREFLLRGINFAAEAKFPTRQNSSSFVDSPCPLDEADTHFQRLQALGFNCIRWVYTWEALEHAGPGVYDDEYIDYTIEMVRKARQHGLYVFMDPHQDVWSRFSGGSGAPKWTLEAAGFNCDNFEATHAAMLYHKDDPSSIKMLWSSNYFRLVSQTMFTLFFAGSTYAPKCELNGENVGTYLQKKYFAALNHFMERVKESGVEVLGWESLNEPGHGLVGHPDLSQLSESPTWVKLSTAPTPFQAMLLGQGIAQTVEVYRFTSMGIKRDPSVLVDPKCSAWLNEAECKAVDIKHGWKRSWQGCPWELHGVYESASRKLLKPNYFCGPASRDAAALFIDRYFVQHWDKFYDMVATLSPEWWVLMQAPVNHPPPNLKGMGRPAGKRVVYTPHYYDGLTLMLKRWMWINVDSVGVCRNLYTNPMLAVKVGPRAIRSGFQQQLAYLKKEGLDRVGDVPCLVSEIGIPYDMDQKRAYSDGMFHDQILAMDANHHGLEGSKLSHALWVYACDNTNKYGDKWCGEDLSIWSKDQSDPEIEASNWENGVRAAPSVIRPTPIATQGTLRNFGFDVYKAVFEMEIEATPGTTRVFVPSYYFGDNPTNVWVSSGSFKTQNQVLEWAHGAGRQTLRLKGVPHFSDTMYYYTDHLSKTFTMAKRGLTGMFRKRTTA